MNNHHQNIFRPWGLLIKPFAIVFLSVQLLTRTGLLAYSGQVSDLSFLQGLGVYGWGLLFDIQVLGFYLLPLIFIHLMFRHGRWADKSLQITRFIFFAVYTYIWLFTAVSEYFFWDEFGTRFNFIAVDYLVYTTEVIGNIEESYPLYPLLVAIMIAAIAIVFMFRRSLKLNVEPTSQPDNKYSSLCGLGLAALPLILFPILDLDNVKLSSNQAIRESASNGTYNLFSAYRNNELSYEKFYITQDEKQIEGRVRQLLAKNGDRFLSDDISDVTRLVKGKGPETRKNVIFVVMESMSADFMGVFGNRENLTPEMDALSKKGLFFTDLYATGTRTVRGLEALTLSVPPTPGQSILRRPENGELYSLGYIFQDRGYDTAFIYGGHGYFDNMNEFFGHNGYRIIDRHDFPDEDITFSNVWGVADEDLDNQVMKQADVAYAKKQPFMYEVMTTSNHRPYTFPDNRIDLPSKTGGRSAGVKYADYAVGKFLHDAEKKPWFRDTVFVFVADHTAGAGGKIELSPQKYHIPAIFYAPGFIKPQEYKVMSSQIDIAPTLLGLLNFTYITKFMGTDVLNKNEYEARTFISNYQKVAYMQNGQLTILEPKRKVSYFSNEKPMLKQDIDTNLLDDAVAYYQYTSEWKTRFKRIDTIPKKIKAVKGN